MFNALVIICLFASGVKADDLREKHTVRFDNRCEYGAPRLIQGTQILSIWSPYESNGPLASAIAYLQTGDCEFNGEGCLLVETTLGNPSCPGCGSSTDISLIPPHAFNVPTSFRYEGGCDGQGATCSSPDCKAAFFQTNDNQVQVACQSHNVNLVITFCPDVVTPAAFVGKKHNISSARQMSTAVARNNGAWSIPLPSLLRNLAASRSDGEATSPAVAQNQDTPKHRSWKSSKLSARPRRRRLRHP